MPAINDLAYIQQRLGNCTRCRLSVARENIVFGEGAATTSIMLIGESPGAKEDYTARPFVGDSGVMLTKMLRVMALERSQVYITNLVKCRPPDNRDPFPEEINACMPFLHAQIHVLKPKIILAIGRYAANAMISPISFEPVSDLITKEIVYAHKGNLVPVQAIYHPAYLRRQLRKGDTVKFKQMLQIMRDLARKITHG